MKTKASAIEPSYPTGPSALRLGVYFLVGMLLIWGQLLPSGTQQVADGEALPQVLVWFLAAALLATDRVLVRVVAKPVQAANLPLTISNNLSTRIFWWLLLGLILWLVLATWNVIGHGNLRSAVNGCWQWLALIATGIVFGCLLIDRLANRHLQFWLIGLAWLVSMHGFYQVTISLPADRERFRADPQGMLREADIDAPIGSSTYLLFEQRLQDSSPTGPFALTNSLAGFLVPWIVILLAQLLRPGIWMESSSRFQRWLSVFVLACLSLCLLLTKSRTAWIALGVGVIAVLATHPTFTSFSIRSLRERSLKIGAILLLAIGALWIGLNWWDPKLLSEATRSLAFRTEYWSTTLRIVSDHAWFGIGPGNFQSYYATYKPPLASETVADPHNFLFETLAVAGWPALVLLLGLIFWLARPFFDLVDRGWKGERELSDRRSEAREPALKSKLHAKYSVFAGVIVGAIAIWYGHGAVGPMPDYVPYLASIPVLAIVLMADLVRSRTMKIESWAVDEWKGLGFGPGLLAIGVHLIVSGGWMTPGINNTIAFLVAGLFVSRSDVSFRWPRIEFQIGWLWVAWSLLFVFYLSAWLPNQRTRQVELIVAKRGGIEEQDAFAMRQADGWNPSGYRWLAEVRNFQALREMASHRPDSSSAIDLFRQAALAYRDSDRANWETWTQLGHWEIALSPTRSDSMKRAIEHYEEASRRNPSDVGLLVQVALAAWLADDSALLEKYLSQAETIDANIVHLDRKLSRAILYWPSHVGPPSTKIPPKLWQAARQSNDLPSGWVRAEPVFRFLRSQGKPSANPKPAFN